MAIFILGHCQGCAARFAIGTCNANGIRDDSWHIDLDGTYIGDVNIDTDVTQADLILPSSYSGYSMDPGLYPGCSSVKSRFNSAFTDTFIFSGTHTLTFTMFQNNGANNLFTIFAIPLFFNSSVIYAGGPIISIASLSGTYAVGDIVTRTVSFCV